jgi:hypothetical protein
MTMKKRAVISSLTVRFRQPIAVVQLRRHGRWFDVDWVYADSKIKYSTHVLAKELGTITGIRVKYLLNVVRQP